MAAAARTAPIHVHDAELSTEREYLRDYAEALAWLVALVAIAASVWLAASPRENADFTQPAPPVATAGQFTLVPGGEAYQPDPAGPDEVAVFTPSADAAAPGAPSFGSPFG